MDMQENIANQPGEPAGAEERAGGLEAAPYHPRNLFNLFFRPSRFFASIPLDRRNVSRDLAIFLYGVYRFYGELNEEYLRAAFGRPRAAWTELDNLLAGSWTAFWLLAVPMGLLAGYLAWWINGWWFKIRLKWSGENSPDPVRARMTYAYSTLVASLPVLAHLMVKMVRYSSYSEAYKSGSPLSMFLMIFPLWSILVGYAGASCVKICVYFELLHDWAESRPWALLQRATCTGARRRTSVVSGFASSSACMLR